MAKGSNKVLPTINKPIAGTNEPPELNKHLQSMRATLTAAITGKRNFDKGFAFSVSGLWQLTTIDGHFEHSELKDFVAKMHNGSAESANGVIETICNKLGLFKAMPEIIEPEKKPKKSFGSDEQGWKEYQDKVNSWKRSYNPLKTMLTRTVVVVAYLTDPSRRNYVNIIKSSTNKNKVGCLYINGAMYDTDQQRNREIVPYDKACGDLEERARKQFTLKKRQTVSSGDAVSVKRALDVMQTAIKQDGSNMRSQVLLVNAMLAVKNSIEAMQINWQSTSSTYRATLRDLAYTLISETQGVFAKDLADKTLEALEKYQPPKDEEINKALSLDEAKTRASERQEPHVAEANA